MASECVGDASLERPPNGGAHAIPNNIGFTPINSVEALTDHPEPTDAQSHGAKVQRPRSVSAYRLDGLGVSKRRRLDPTPCNTNSSGLDDSFEASGPPSPFQSIDKLNVGKRVTGSYAADLGSKNCNTPARSCKPAQNVVLTEHRPELLDNYSVILDDCESGYWDNPSKEDVTPFPVFEEKNLGLEYVDDQPQPADDFLDNDIDWQELLHNNHGHGGGERQGTERKNDYLGEPLPTEDLLDEQVDWEEVILSMPKQTDELTVLDPRNNANGMASQSQQFSRPGFPRPVKSKSIVAGLSSQTTIKTCFHASELLQEGALCLSAGQDVVFELYARVIHSERHSSAKTQDFELMDLSIDDRTLPAAVLSDWKAGSALDQQSQLFLGDKSRLCRCVCRFMRTKNNASGLMISVMSIREVDWEEIALIANLFA